MPLRFEPAASAASLPDCYGARPFENDPSLQGRDNCLVSVDDTIPGRAFFTLTTSLPKSKYVEYAILWRKIPIRRGVFAPSSARRGEGGSRRIIIFAGGNVSMLPHAGWRIFSVFASHVAEGVIVCGGVRALTAGLNALTPRSTEVAKDGSFGDAQRLGDRGSV